MYRESVEVEWGGGRGNAFEEVSEPGSFKWGYTEIGGFKDWLVNTCDLL
jgi:hypothetical protein